VTLLTLQLTKKSVASHKLHKMTNNFMYLVRLETLDQPRQRHQSLSAPDASQVSAHVPDINGLERDQPDLCLLSACLSYTASGLL